ncbi:MAG TPA: 7TM diverse intracellular signaling domain-containing protein [Flavitalea sp.]|nr:7TM diverse intracellular signaling domain-containing protein [Flavitalea sp.]
MGAVKEQDIPLLNFTNPAVTRKTVPDSLMEQDCYLRFSVYNDTDSSGQYFFNPGYYIRDATMYMASGTNTKQSFRKVSSEKVPFNILSGSMLIRPPQGDTTIYFMKFRFVRSGTNTYQPKLIERNFYSSWLRMVNSKDASLDIISLLCSGVMVMMMVYSLAVYIQNRHTEFLYYAAYVFHTALVLFLKVVLPYERNVFHVFFEEYLDLMILCGGVFFYLGFIRQFLSTGTKDPFLEKILQYAATTMAVLITGFSVVYFGTDRFIILNILENYVIKVLIFFISIIVIIYSFRKKDILLNYLAAGNIALVTFMMVSQGIIIFKWTFDNSSPLSIFNRSLLYYALGLVFEMFFFQAGLAYKNKKDIIGQVKERERFKLENERKEFEKQMAMLAVRQEERDRISADMHDDLGSGVTAIRLMSEIAKSKMNTEDFPEIEKISSSANELLGKMNAIIWTMKSSNDTLENLVAYLRAFATEYFDGSSVNCIVQVGEFSEMEMSGEKRRNIFLSFKETLNNILKHAQATEVLITMRLEGKRLMITIKDNGTGIDTGNLRRFGNGLSNIKKRMQDVNGAFSIVNDLGTLVSFDVEVNSD